MFNSNGNGIPAAYTGDRFWDDDGSLNRGFTMHPTPPLLARINLQADSHADPLWVNLTSFLEFSHEFSEALDDLVSRFVGDSHPQRSAIPHSRTAEFPASRRAIR